MRKAFGVGEPDNDDNRDLYGREISARDILIAKRVRAPHEAAPFMAALSRTMPPQNTSEQR